MTLVDLESEFNASESAPAMLVKLADVAKSDRIEVLLRIPVRYSIESACAV